MITPGRNGVGIYLYLGASGNLIDRNTILYNTAYGLFLYDSASNLPDVITTGPNMNTSKDNGIADFREFTGALATTSKVKTKSVQTPKGPMAKKKSQ